MNSFQIPSKLVFYFKTILFILLFLSLGLFYCQRINIITTDTGRHLKNGEIFFERGVPIDTNYYSYTQKDFPAVNHHWATGVVFYLVQKFFGMHNLVFFYAGLVTIAFILFFVCACRTSSFSIALLMTLICLPLIVQRTDLRPEGFSFLLLGAFIFILMGYYQRSLGYVWLAVLPILQIAWVNLHIFFIFGPFLVFVFLIQCLISGFKWSDIKPILIVCVMTSLACLVNPFGLQGVLTPFTIFKEYGYMVAENQPVLFMQHRFPELPIYLHFEIIFGLFLILMIILILLKKMNTKMIFAVILLAFFSALAWKTGRAIVIFGLMFIPLGAFFLKEIIESIPMKLRGWVNCLMLGICCLFLFFILISKSSYYSLYRVDQLSLQLPDTKKQFIWIDDLLMHIGELTDYYPNMNQSAEFFKLNNIKGSIFNNYDIGGYLIYHLFPKERVFVDNRPEAYSVSFFKDIYVPMQESEDVWKQKSEQYGLNAIYFYRQDMTPWAQPFLIRRVKDPLWATVYVDLYTIILLKRNSQNMPIISQYELPQSIFQFK